MGYPWKLFKTLTIANGQQESGVLDFQGTELEHMRAVVNVVCPAALTETVNLMVAKSAAGTFGIQTSGGLAIALVLPISGVAAATHIGPLVAGAIKLRATAAVGADRSFDVMVMPV